MSLKTATGVAQNVMSAQFAFSFDDTMVNTAGNTVDFGAANLGGAAGAFDVIELPVGAIVVGGDLAVKTAFDAATYAIIVGDATDTDRFLATADRKAVGTSALLVPGFVSTGEAIRVTITAADVCTTGEVLLTVLYVVDGRVNEVL